MVVLYAWSGLSPSFIKFDTMRIAEVDSNPNDLREHFESTAMNIDSKISADLKEKYLQDLVRDPKKDFAEEFIRTTDLEAVLIRQYGFDGLKLISSTNKNELFHLGNFPSACPWSHLNGETLQTAIDKVFDPLENKLPELISNMKERVRFIYAENNGTQWKLHYLLDMKLYDERDYFLIYSGGQAAADPPVTDRLAKFNWSIPKDLKELYAVHNGFGAEGDSKCILSSTEISVMGEMMNPIVAEKGFTTDGYVFDDLLEFFPDGAGNAQCFLRKGKSFNTTVDWDHETWELSEESGFFEFVDERMSELDEE